jgi:hypothetical protein
MGGDEAGKSEGKKKTGNKVEKGAEGQDFKKKDGSEGVKKFDKQVCKILPHILRGRRAETCH